MPAQNWNRNSYAAKVLARSADLADEASARKNAPAIVLGEMGMTLLVTLAFAVAANAAVLFFHLG